MKKLIHVLIAKSILDTLLVGTIAVGTYMNAFPPHFHGWGEAVTASQTISGWVVTDADPWRRVEVQLFVDGKFTATQEAHHSRPDVFAAGWSKDEWHGYNFTVQGLTAGSHEARIYAIHPSRNGGRYSLQILGDPIPFDVNADGSWK
jgi:hypothetical protein